MLEKMRLSLKGSSSRFYKMWQPFITYIDALKPAENYHYLFLFISPYLFVTMYYCVITVNLYFFCFVFTL